LIKIIFKKNIWKNIAAKQKLCRGNTVEKYFKKLAKIILKQKILKKKKNQFWVKKKTKKKLLKKTCYGEYPTRFRVL